MAGTQPFSIQDCAAYPFVSGAPGTLVDVVAIRSIQQKFAQTATENRGDDAILSTAVTLDGIDLTIVLAAFTPASIAAIAGGTASTTGTGATAITTLKRLNTDVVAYYKLAGQTRAKDSDGGAGRITYNKVAYAGGPDFTMGDKAFADFTVNAKAMPDDTTGQLYQYDAYATWTALA